MLGPTKSSVSRAKTCWSSGETAILSVMSSACSVSSVWATDWSWQPQPQNGDTGQYINNDRAHAPLPGFLSFSDSASLHVWPTCEYFVLRGERTLWTFLSRPTTFLLGVTEHLKLSDLKTVDYRRLWVFDLVDISYEIIPWISVIYNFQLQRNGWLVLPVETVTIQPMSRLVEIYNSAADGVLFGWTERKS